MFPFSTVPKFVIVQARNFRARKVISFAGILQRLGPNSDTEKRKQYLKQNKNQ